MMTRKILSVLLALMLCLSLAIPVFAVSTEERFLYDEADLLNSREEAKLIQRLENISHQASAQVVIVTIPSLDGVDVAGYTDELYDSMGFGYGQQHDGVLLLVCMSPRRYEILSNGYAGAVIGRREIRSLCDLMDAYLPEGQYSAAFHSFADQCGDYLEQRGGGHSISLGLCVIISLVIGLIVGLIVAFVLKGQLKTVHSQYRAHDYVRAGSLDIRVYRDIFLWRDVSRTRRETDDHSGSSRNRGGGSF